MKRLRTVDHTRVQFGSHEWGGPSIVVPVLPGSVVYADRIRCRWLPDGTPPADRVDAYVSNPVYVLNPDQSLTVYEQQGGNAVTDDTLRGRAALDAWDAWLGGVGVEDVSR